MRKAVIVLSILLLGASYGVVALLATTMDDKSKLAEQEQRLEAAQIQNEVLKAQCDSAIQSAKQLNPISDTECKEALKFLRDMWPVVEQFKNGMDDAIAKNPRIVGEPTTKTSIKRIK